jgi:hypothetical protein
LRPEKLELLLESFIDLNRKIFVFIDRATEPHIDLNKEVFDVAQKFQSRLNIEINWAGLHQGVAHGVPTALDWAFSYVDELIILEDDCFPNSFSLQFFENQVFEIGKKLIVMASASSPWADCGDFKDQIPLTLSSYPLIWGWSTNRASWMKIKILIKTKTPHLRVLNYILANPSKIREICFFYAAVIRVNRKKLSAWDSPVALEMLLSGYKAIISNVNLIQNSGQDDIASHYSNPDMSLNQIVSTTEEVLANKYLDVSKFWSDKVDREIEHNVYNLKNKHILSPIKALIGM